LERNLSPASFLCDAAAVIIEPVEGNIAMIGRAGLACIAVLLAFSVSPAAADPLWDGGYGAGWAIHSSIYQLENRIAFLEADPEIDDGYKAPIIGQARTDVLRLRATLPPATWRWANPCCYGRRPIHIR
jgi:hypothetical protein